jgi:hypothetical protein
MMDAAVLSLDVTVYGDEPGSLRAEIHAKRKAQNWVEQ